MLLHSSVFEEKFYECFETNANCNIVRKSDFYCGSD